MDEEVEIVSLRATHPHRRCRAGPLSSRPRRRRSRRRRRRSRRGRSRAASGCRSRSSSAPRSASTGSRARRSCSRRRRRPTSTPSSTAVSVPAEFSYDHATRRGLRCLGEPVVYRAGLGGAGRAADADPITTEVIRHGLNSAAEPMKRTLIRTSFSPIIYEVLDFAVAIYDRADAPARAGAEPAVLHGHDELLHRGRRRGGRRRGRARAGRHHPHQRPVQDRLAPAGRRGRDAGVPARRGADRLHGDQGALARHRRARRSTAPTRSTSSRRARSSPASSSTAAASSSRTSTGWRSRTRACRRWSLGDINAEVVGVRARRAASSSDSCERYGLETFSTCVERMYDHGEAVVRSYIEKLPDGRYVGHGEMDDDGITDEPIPFEVMLEVDGSTARLDFTNAPDGTAWAGQLPDRVDRLGGRVDHDDARRRRRGAERGPLPPDRGRRAAGLDVPSARRPRRASSTGGRRCRRSRPCYNAVAKAMPEAVSACTGGDLCAALLVGRPRGDGRVLGRRLTAPGRPGRARSTATGRARSCTTSRRRRGSRRSRSGRRRTRG